MSLPLVFLGAAVLLVALVIERARLERHKRAIPLRIAVSGTRGKTSVVRLLASVLREDGRRVLAKTTGSKPTLILPDGSIEEIRRRGQPSIIEQKRLLQRGADLGAAVVLAEIMSIHPENHRVETHQLLEPAVMEFEEQLFLEQPVIEQKALELMDAEDLDEPMAFREFLTRYTNNWAGATMQRWWEMGDFFWAYYARGW